MTLKSMESHRTIPANRINGNRHVNRYKIQAKIYFPISGPRVGNLKKHYENMENVTFPTQGSGVGEQARARNRKGGKTYYKNNRK